jgi:TP53 regulating kinase and related kinases
MFASVLVAYGQELGTKGWELVKKRLDDVRLRGRKRSMVG